MGTKTPHQASRHDEPGGDPWAAFGYLVAGVVFYGGIGYGLSVWLNASYLLPIGILVGAGFGFYLVFNRYRFRGDDEQVVKPAKPATGTRTTGSSPGTTPMSSTTPPSSPTPIDHDRPGVAGPARDRARPDRDDRGDSS